MSDISGAAAHVNITATSAGFAEVNAALTKMQDQLAAVQARLKASVSSGVMAENTFNGIAASLEAATVAAQSYTKTLGTSAVAQEGAAASAAESVAALQGEAAALEAASLSANKMAFGMRGVSAANRASRAEIATWKAGMVGSIRSVEDQTGRLRKVTSGMQATNFSGLGRNMAAVGTALKDTTRSGIATVGTINALKTGQQSLFATSLTGWQRMRMGVTAFKSNITSMFTTMRNGFKQTQWIGRQLMMGISIPLAALGATAIYTFTKVNQAQSRLQKLTTETGESIDHANARMEAMIPTIRAIGHEFGQVESITTNVMGDWASMGFKDQALTDVTELTSQFALLGSIDLSDSTDFIRKIYATFGDNNLDKTKVLLDQLNGIEEVAAINLSDLAVAMPITAQSADKYNMSAAQLAATLAGMVEQGVGASEAATALRFAMQRMYNPTKKANEALLSMNINPFDQLTGEAKDATTVLTEIGEKLKSPEFTDEFKAHAIGDIFGSRQVDRIMAALKGMTSSTSDYADALRVAGQGEEALAQRREQQIAQIQQTPQFKFKQMKADLATFASDLGKFLIGPLLKITSVLLKVMKFLNDLSDPVKKMIAGFLLFGAILGPIVYVTSLMGEAFMTVGLGIAKVIPGLKIVTAEEALLKKLNEGVNAVIGQTDGLLMVLKESSVKTAKAQVDSAETVSGATNSMKGAIEVAIDQIISAEQAHVVSMEETTTAAEAAAAAQTAAAETAAAAQIAAIESVTAAEVLAAEERAAARRGELLTATHIPIRGAGGRFVRNPDMHTPIPLGPASAPTSVEPIPLGPVGSTGGGIAGTVASSRGAGATAASRAAIAEVDDVIDKAVTASTSGGERAGTTFFDGFRGRVGPGMTRVLSGIRHPMRTMMRTFGEEGALGYLKSMKTKMTGGQGIKGMLSKLAPKSSRDASGVASMASIAGGVAGIATAAAVVLVVVATIGAAFYVVFSAVKKHWKAFKEEATKSIGHLKDAWDKIKKAATHAIDKIKNAFQDAVGGGHGAEGAKKTAQTVGRYVSMIGDAIALLGDLIGNIIDWLGPLFTWLGHVMGSSMRLITDLFSGHFVDALKDFGRLIYSVVGEPILRLFDAIVDGGIRLLRRFLDLASSVSGFLDFIPGMDGVSNAIQSASDALGTFSDRFNATDQVNEWIFGAGGQSEANDQAKTVGEEIGKNVGDGINSGVDNAGPGPDDISKWMPDWLSAVKSRLDQSINALKDQAKKAMDIRFAANLKAYDDRIKAIDAVTKAEEKALARKKYIEDRRKLIEERALQHENYMRDRALAIYEGRIDDARMMDLQEQKDKREGNKSLQDLDAERHRTLVQEERDHQKEMLEIQKQALDERQQALKEAFDAQLELITQYAPRTIGEFQSMLDNITGLLGDYGINTWPGLMDTGMGLFLDVIRNANTDIVRNAAYAGHSASTAWLSAFITGDARAAILAGQADAAAATTGGGGGGGGAGGSGYGFSHGSVSRDDYYHRHPNRAAQAGVFHAGGYVGSGPAADVPATLQTGEYVVQRSAVNRLGLKALHQINNANGMKPETGDGLGEVVEGGMNHFIRSLTRRWMTDDGTHIAGLRPGDIKSRFEAGGTVGGVTNAALTAYLNPMSNANLASIEAFANWAASLFPGLHVSSVNRPGAVTAHGGHTSLHALGRAADIGGGGQGSDPNLPMNKLFAYMLNAATNHTLPLQELIHNSSIWSTSRGLHGWPYSDHFDHVHIGLLEGFQNALSAAQGGGAVGGNVADWIRQAMELTGVPASWLQPLIARAMQESSGNPLAQNNWDSNARAGHPSKGLMQTIDSTFSAYALPGHGNIWNPVDNAAAAIRYIIARYGSVFNLPSGGYHTGGLVTPNGAVAMAMGGMVPFDNYPALLHKGEAVIPKPLTEKIQNAGECNHGGDTIVNINADTFVGDFEHFKKQMKKYEVDIVPKKNRVAGKTSRRIGGK